MKSLVIIESVYKKLLVEIQQNLQKTQQKITRQKVEMSWKIGKLVEEHLLTNRDETYGKNLIKRLEQDTKISRNALYKMHSFYQSYPKLPTDDPKLNWSHYRVLAGIEDKVERKYLEDLTKEGEWSSDFLQQKVGELKSKKPQQTTQENQRKNKSKKTAVPEKLKATRGKLFTYELARVKGSDRMFVDLGFNIFSRVEGKFKEGEVVESVKDGPHHEDGVTVRERTTVRERVTARERAVVNKNLSPRLHDEVYSYYFKKSAVTKKEMHAYKAYLDRVVDGDTIRVTLDLGFNIFHKEILRLAQINAPEMKTKEGKKSFLS